MDNWYVVLNGKKSGPYQLEKVKKALSVGKIDFDTLVWKTGMPNWKAIKNCPEFLDILSDTPPPLPTEIEEHPNVQENIEDNPNPLESILNSSRTPKEELNLSLGKKATSYTKDEERTDYNFDNSTLIKRTGAFLIDCFVFAIISGGVGFIFSILLIALFGPLPKELYTVGFGILNLFWIWIIFGY